MAFNIKSIKLILWLIVDNFLLWNHPKMMFILIISLLAFDSHTVYHHDWSIQARVYNMFTLLTIFKEIFVCVCLWVITIVPTREIWILPLAKVCRKQDKFNKPMLFIIQIKFVLTDVRPLLNEVYSNQNAYNFLFVMIRNYMENLWNIEQ